MPLIHQISNPFYFQIGSFFMINLCLVVIATQFSETKKREMERMRQERARYTSTSTLASSTNNSEPTTCYAEIVKYIAHLWRRSKRRLLKKYRLYKYEIFRFFLSSHPFHNGPLICKRNNTLVWSFVNVSVLFYIFSLWPRPGCRSILIFWSAGKKI